MRFTPVSVIFTISATALLIAVVQTASIPVSDLAVVHSDEHAITTDLVPWNEESGISTLEFQQIDPRVGDAVYIELIKGGVKVFEAACTAGPWICALSVVAATLVAFFAIYSATNNQGGPGVFVPTVRRDIQNILDSFKFHEIYTPTDECDATCQLKRLTPEGEWTKFAQTVSNGVIHELHHYYNGSTRGVRAWGVGTASTSRTKRTDQQENTGFIGDYYWDDSNQAAYDSFDSNSEIIQNASEGIIDFLEPNGGIEACVDFADNTGPLDRGLFTLGWNNAPFEFSSQSALQSDLNSCTAPPVPADPL